MGDQLQKQYTNLVAAISKTAYTLNKHDHIRMKHWLDKLTTPMTNAIWKQNRNLYLRGELMKPFNQSPPEGPLPKITIYDIPYPIRIKLSDDEHKVDKHTPSSHKASQNHSRKNSTGNADQRRSLSRGNKNMEHKKHLLFETQMDDKQNRSQYLKLFNNNKSINLDQSLFSSKNRHKPRNSTQKIQLNHNYSTESIPNDKLKIKGNEILKKALKLLGRHYDQFEGSITYKTLIEKIVDTGDRIGENLRDVSVPNMEESTYIEKYNQRIKDKLFQTDLNSMEFMIYLNSVV